MSVPRGRIGRLIARSRRLLDPPEGDGERPGRPHRLDGIVAVGARHPQFVDGAIAVAILSFGLINNLPGRRPAEVVVFTCLLALPLAARRRAPLTVFGIIAAVAFVQWLSRVPLFADTALFIALYTVAFAWPIRAVLAATAVLEGGVLLATVRWSADESQLQTFALLSGVVFAAVVSGIHMRSRQAYVASLLERASRLERERDQQAQLSAAAERARLAREMHDLVAHSLAVVIALANGAAAKLRRDPEQSREALESIATLGGQALEDIRRLLSVLRTEDDPASRAPQPGIDEIPDLVVQAAKTGLAATLTVHGEPVPVAAGPSLSAYRIVQEAITNTLKHADGACSLAVSIRWTADDLQISVVDDGRRAGAPSTASGGLGLLGMTERAALHGGAVTAGPRDDAGWTVTASLPASGGVTP